MDKEIEELAKWLYTYYWKDSIDITEYDELEMIFFRKLAREVKIIELEARMQELMADGTIYTLRLGDRLKELNQQLKALKG